MASGSLGERGGTAGPARGSQMIPREYLRVIAIWSIIPAYAAAGAFFGWLVDRWLDTMPFGVAIGLILGLVLAVRDMIRLRDELGFGEHDES